MFIHGNGVLMHQSIELKNVVTLLAESESCFDPELLRSLWRLARSWDDHEILSLLTRRLDLPDDLVEEASGLTAIPIRVSYLTRANLKKDVFLDLLRLENRAGVLSGVCEGIDLSTNVDVSSIIYQKLKNKPSKSLALTVVEKDGFCQSAYVHALLCIGDSSVTSDCERTMMKRVASIITDEAAVLDLLRNDKSKRGFDRALYILSCEGVTEEVRNIILDTYILKYVKAGVERFNTPSDNVKLVRHLSLVERSLYGLLSCEDVQISVLENVKSVLALCNVFSNSLQSRLVSYDPVEASTKRNAVINLLTEVSKSSDQTLLKSVLARDDIDKSVLLAIGLNPQASSEVKDLFFSKVLSYEEEALAWAASERNDRYTLMLYQEYPHLVTSDKFQAFSSIRNGITLCLTSYSGDDSDYSYRKWYLIDEVVSNLDDHHDLLRFVPWSYLAECSAKSSWHRSSSHVMHLARIFAELKQEHLGGDVTKWETIAVLADGFSGSIEELVVSASTL